jgi:hypothetical protein
MPFRSLLNGITRFTVRVGRGASCFCGQRKQQWRRSLLSTNQHYHLNFIIERICEHSIPNTKCGTHI